MPSIFFLIFNKIYCQFIVTLSYFKEQTYKTVQWALQFLNIGRNNHTFTLWLYFHNCTQNKYLKARFAAAYILTQI